MPQQPRPVPTKVVLLGESKHFYLRVYAENTKLGYFNVDAIPARTGACLKGLRKQGRKHAKSLGVPFEERLGKWSDQIRN